MPRSPRHRGWCFTIHIDEDRLWQVPTFPDTSFVVFQLEQCPTTLRVHFQGYCHLPDLTTLKNVKRFLNCEWAHLEPARGTPADNIAYCTKTDSAVPNSQFQHGNPPTPGVRNDLTRFVTEVLSTGFDSSKPDHMSQLLLRPSGVRALLQHLPPARLATDPLLVFVLWGPSGTGKSRYARDLSAATGQRLHVFLPPRGGHLWFDGYDNQPIALLDEFASVAGPAPLALDYMLQLTDRYYLRAESKGTSTTFAPRYLFITSNRHPDDWYHGRDPRLHRRITLTINCTDEWLATPEAAALSALVAPAAPAASASPVASDPSASSAPPDA